MSSRSFEYPSCVSIGNGCFLAEPSCKSTTTSYLQDSTENSQIENTAFDNNNDSFTKDPKEKNKDDDTVYNEIIWIFLVTLIVGSSPIWILCMIRAYYKKEYRNCPKHRDADSHEEELDSFIQVPENQHDRMEWQNEVDNSREKVDDHEHSKIKQGNDNLIYQRDLDAEAQEETELKSIIQENQCNTMKSTNEESAFDQAVFEQWQQDNYLFVSTNACKEVEKLIKRQNLVIVAGHSGSGKSAIIQHIALKYRSQGWIVRPVNDVAKIVDAYLLQSKILFILNDPIGKESFDEMAYSSWRKHEDPLNACLKKVKLLLSCRKYILNNNRVKGVFKEKLNIVDISNGEFQLNDNEKMLIWNCHSSNKKLSEDEFAEIFRIEAYFPLLCKLYFSNEENLKIGLRFFKEPVAVFEEEIRDFRELHKEKYCALVLLVFFNNALCVSDLLENETSREKFKRACELCGMKKNAAPYSISDHLESLKGFFVKKIGDVFHFYHDFVMEVTTFVFGSDYPADTIKYADIDFLRKRVNLESCKEKTDQFTIYLSDKYIDDLGKRLFTGMFGDRFLDVFFNPCLKNEKVAGVLIKEFKHNPEKLKQLLVKTKIQIKEEEFIQQLKESLLSRFVFVCLENQISPLFALIVFCHTDLSLYCLTSLKNVPHVFTDNCLFSAVCCNGSLELFHMFLKSEVEKCFIENWNCLNPIHIVSAFHNFEILCELIQFDIDVNLIFDSDKNNGYTPLLLAAGNETEENKGKDQSSTIRCKKTIEILLENGADINLCNENGASPLIQACYTRNKSTIQLLLSKGAAVNSCLKNGVSPLLIACRNGRESIAELLIANGADINLCEEGGVSPFYIACQFGHNGIVQLLLSKGASINSCLNNGASPLFIACQNGHNSIVQLILDNGVDINSYRKAFVSPLITVCKSGLESTLQLLITNGAEINLRFENGFTPLFIASQDGYESIVKLLLIKGADVNLRTEHGASPLHIACSNGHESTMRLLLKNGANVNSFENNGGSPLFCACQNNHDSIVRVLLSSGANINSCLKDGTSPLLIACQKRHDRIVEVLLKNGADVNLCGKTGINPSPIYIACETRNLKTVVLLHKNGADINLCNKNGASPLYIASENGEDSIVKYLLSNGADINLCLDIGASPLFIACLKGHESTVKILLNNGADIDLCEENGISPLFKACENGNYGTVQILLDYKAAINLCSENGTSPLYIACLKGYYSIVKLLLSNGADINLCLKDGTSPLFAVCKMGHERILQLLLQNEATINSREINGNVPLFLACLYGHDSIVQILLRNGADINLCLNDGSSPLSLAYSNRHYSTVILLIRNGARLNNLEIFIDNNQH
ncbi:uncharacterized protein [Magallana gigas]|uniref:uncharacterized protein n=1 Tax=Magallana gigas TaxID=29159 RepID=UPI00333ED431